MSKMSELEIEIIDLIERDFSPVSIAKILNVPLSMVYDVLENWDANGNTEVFNPYGTINS